MYEQLRRNGELILRGTMPKRGERSIIYGNQIEEGRSQWGLKDTDCDLSPQMLLGAFQRGAKVCNLL
jgi:hypothetical protein